MQLLVESELVNSSQCVIGIDPGLSGAVWKIGRGNFSGFRDFKTVPQIAQAIRKLSVSTPLPNMAVIELVHAIPKQGVCSTFSFGKATGAAVAALALSLPQDCPAREVSPQEWQKFFRQALGVPQAQEFDSKAIVRRMFPSFTDFFDREKDHNSADAVLMAVWGLCQIKQAGS